MFDPKKISILDYTYDLPDERIALFPLKQRDQSKLLVYKSGLISEDAFINIHEYLPADCLMIFNESKVINARIIFEKSTGSTIEIFCLEPAELINDYATVMSKKGSVSWKCFVGGVSKWKEPFLEKKMNHQGSILTLKASIIEKLHDAFMVAFTWDDPSVSFAEILSLAGDIPLPPYIKRKTESEDSSRYQTIYAKEEGSVAAPTAGLHFTDTVFESLKKKNIETGFVTLHVGAGTFKPVKAATMEEHDMHAEWIEVKLSTIQQIKSYPGKIIATGTTSLRTLESLYWLGIKAALYPNANDLKVEQWDAYLPENNSVDFSFDFALEALINWMHDKKLDHIFTQTQLLITPGYDFKVVNAIVTNFHQPQSTLLLLVAAAIGEDWRKCYDYALKHDFRFLSFGDSSLIFIHKKQ